MSLRRLPAPVVSVAHLGGRATEMVLEAPEIARTLRPGQFVMVGLPESRDVFLDRPMSYFRRDERTLSILFRSVGRGTRALEALEAGEAVEIMGPLGRPLPELGKGGRVTYVGGGVGVPPLYDACRTRVEAGGTARVLLGARTADEILGEAAFRRLDVDVEVATDDGSAGRRGRVTDLLTGSDGPLVACGPEPMLRSVQAFARSSGALAYLILEARMACGFGACLGCTVPRVGKGDVYHTYLRVCTEGPVFRSEEVAL